MSLRKLFEDDAATGEQDGLIGLYNKGKEYITSLGSQLGGQVKPVVDEVGKQVSDVYNGLKQIGSDAQAKGAEVVQNFRNQATGVASDYNSMSIPDFIKVHPNISAGVGIPAAALIGAGALALSKRLKRR